jgi:hypothetical protein
VSKIERFYLYKDNILSKLKENGELDKILEYFENYDEEKIKIKINNTPLSKLKVETETFLHIIKEMKDFNEKMIVEYLKLSNLNKEN